MSNIFAEDIKKLTEENTYFRKVIYTGKNSQIVVMSIPIGEDIGLEMHQDIDQILFFIDGEGKVIIGDEQQAAEEHDAVFVPAGEVHNVINTGDEDLKLFTVYSPPEHPDGTIHKTKEEANKGSK